MKNTRIKNILACTLSIIMLIPTTSFAAPAQAASAVGEGGNPLRIWFTTPGNVAGSGSWWQEDVLAIGNGHMGGMVFGGVTQERVHFNEKTLWTGNPTNGSTYNGGNRTTVWAAADMQTVRAQLDNKSQYVWGYSSGTSGAFSSVSGSGLSGTYQDFGDIYLNFTGLSGTYTNYVRALDMTTGVTTVNFTLSGVDYAREYFASYPDDVMVMRLTASEAGKISFGASITPYTTNTSNTTNTASGDTITYRGQLTNQMQYEAQLKVLNEGGARSASGGTITVTGADAVTLIFACGTDYENQMTRMPHYRTGQGRPSAKLTQNVNDAAAKSYSALKERHIADHSALFSRVSVDLNGGYVPDIPTDELVARYQRSMIPEQPYVNVAREGGSPTATVSGQYNTTYANTRIVDNNNNSIWISNSASNPYATITLPAQKKFDMLQLVCVTPEFIVEYDTDPGTADVWAPLPNLKTTIELEHEFQDAMLTFDPITTNKIRARWDSTRTGLGNKSFMNRTLGEFRAYDTSRPANIAAIATEKEQRALEVMAYQMGRYMTIAASREGDLLPTNLCGIWLIGAASSLWNADFHFNINVQMNYWPTLTANLAECETVFNDYIASDSIRLSGRRTAEYYGGAKFPTRTWADEIGDAIGFMVHVQNGPFGHTSPGNSQEWGWNPTGSVWALQSAYDYYLYTKDIDYLRNKIYPMMREMTMFWYDYLWYSNYQQRWVVAPSHSPEQGPTVNGSTYDQTLVWQQFEYTIQAAEILGVDQDKIPLWRARQEGLKPIQIGDDGQIKEWYEETTIGRAKAGNLAEVDIPNWRAGISPTNLIVAHRHPSHLMGLYPGTLINKDSEDYVRNAAKVSLDERGFGATSWGKSHKINAWARTGLGEKEAYYMIRSMVGGGNGGFMKNLFSSHGNNGNGTINYTDTRIFQIDGNFGYASGFNEVLLQSHLGYVQFLPAIYTPAWHTGTAKGLVARGNFVVDMDWENGTANYFDVTARKGGAFIGEYRNLSKFKVTDSAGKPVAFKALSDDKISFETTVGETYRLLNTYVFKAAGSGGAYTSSLKNNSGAAVEGYFVLAVYDVNNRLVTVDHKAFVAPADGSAAAEFSALSSDYEGDGYKVVAYCWDKGFAPVVEALKL